MTTIVDVIQNFKDALQTGLRDADIKASDGKDFELIFFGEDSKILPCIIFQALEVCPAETFSTTGVTMWNFGLVIRYPFTDYKGFIAGLDPHNEEGVLRMVLQKAEECGLFVPQDSPDSVGLALDADGMAMQVWEYRAALAMGTTGGPGVPPAEPTVPAPTITITVADSYTGSTQDTAIDIRGYNRLQSVPVAGIFTATDADGQPVPIYLVGIELYDESGNIVNAQWNNIFFESRNSVFVAGFNLRNLIRALGSSASYVRLHLAAFVNEELSPVGNANLWFRIQ